MPITYTQVSNPVWNDAAQSTIKALVTFAHIAKPVYFVASPLDVEAHGQELFADLKAGKYGPVGPYVAPAPSPATTATPSSADVPSAALISAVTQAVVTALNTQSSAAKTS